MAYTWTTGEVITAEKLNNTGTGYDLIVFFDIVNTTVSAIGLSFSELLEKITNGSIFALFNVNTVSDTTVINSNVVTHNSLNAFIQIVFSGYVAGSTVNVMLTLYESGNGDLDFNNDNMHFTWTYSNGEYIFTESNSLEE